MNFCTKKSYYVLVNYIKEKYGIKVVSKPGVEVCYVDSNKTICIDKNLSNNKKIILLAHEIGHAINTKNGLEYELNINSKMSKIQSSKLLTNEIMAWETGKNILKETNVNFCDYEFEKVKSNCINTYVLSSVESIYGCSLNRLNSKRRI